MYIGTAVLRGCLDKIPDDIAYSCRDPEDDRCKQCAGEKCNKERTGAHECYK